jgi:hypothetical protein
VQLLSFIFLYYPQVQSKMKYFMSLFVILVLALIALTETTNANPGQEQHDVNSVAEAIRYLLELENKQNFGRPR